MKHIVRQSCAWILFTTLSRDFMNFYNIKVHPGGVVSILPCKKHLNNMQSVSDPLSNRNVKHQLVKSFHICTIRLWKSSDKALNCSNIKHWTSCKNALHSAHIHLHVCNQEQGQQPCLTLSQGILWHFVPITAVFPEVITVIISLFAFSNTTIWFRINRQTIYHLS